MSLQRLFHRHLVMQVLAVACLNILLRPRVGLDCVQNVNSWYYVKQLNSALLKRGIRKVEIHLHFACSRMRNVLYLHKYNSFLFFFCQNNHGLEKQLTESSEAWSHYNLIHFSFYCNCGFCTVKCSELGHYANNCREAILPNFEGTNRDVTKQIKMPTCCEGGWSTQPSNMLELYVTCSHYIDMLSGANNLKILHTTVY